MSKRHFRLVQGLLSLFTLFIIATAFYLQYGAGLQPCPLCLMQRGCAFLLLFFCLTGMNTATLKRSKLVCLLQMMTALAGLFFAARQLWLQSLPAEQVPACMPGLDILIRYFPWQNVLKALFWGAGDCAEVTWQFLGLSMPAWSAFYFLMMFAGCGFLFYRISQSLNRFE